MIYGKNRVNNEMGNIESNIVEDAKTYLTEYIKIVNDKQVLIYSVSELTDELMEGLDVNSSNDTAIKEVKDFKKPAVIKSIDQFNSYIKQETKKKDTAKEHIEKVNAKKKIALNMMLIINQLLMMKLKNIKDKQKIIKQRFKSLLQKKENYQK